MPTTAQVTNPTDALWLSENRSRNLYTLKEQSKEIGEFQNNIISVKASAK